MSGGTDALLASADDLLAGAAEGGTSGKCICLFIHLFKKIIQKFNNISKYTFPIFSDIYAFLSLYGSHHHQFHLLQHEQGFQLIGTYSSRFNAFLRINNAMLHLDDF